MVEEILSKLAFEYRHFLLLVFFISLVDTYIYIVASQVIPVAVRKWLRLRYVQRIDLTFVF